MWSDANEAKQAVDLLVKWNDIDVEDDVSILAEYANGAQAVFLTSTGEYPGTNRLEISGSLGKAVVENGTLTWTLLKEDERKVRVETKVGFPHMETEKEVLVQEGPESGHCGILQNFTDAVRSGTPLLAPGIEGIRGLSLSNAAYLSADRGGAWVELPVDEEAFAALLARRQAEETDREKILSGEVLSGAYSERWKVSW